MSRESYSNPSRRHFLLHALGAGGTLAGMSVAPGVLLISPAVAQTGTGNQPNSTTKAAGPANQGINPGANPDANQGADPSRRWGLLVDTSRCTQDCTACVTACQQEHGWQVDHDPHSAPQWIRKLELSGEAQESISLPMMCQHCKHPPCASVCPTQATFQRADGIVLVDKHRCIGCRYCMIACPFKARFMPHRPLDTATPKYPRAKSTAEGCTLCVHRIDRGQQPACVERCAAQGNGALLFGDLNDPHSAISQALQEHGGGTVRADLGLEPAVYYQGIS